MKNLSLTVLGRGRRGEREGSYYTDTDHALGGGGGCGVGGRRGREVICGRLNGLSCDGTNSGQRPRRKDN
jgi:hypothetical protein